MSNTQKGSEKQFHWNNVNVKRDDQIKLNISIQNLSTSLMVLKVCVHATIGSQHRVQVEWVI